MIKFSSKVDEEVWKDFKALANESHQQISGLLTEEGKRGQIYLFD